MRTNNLDADVLTGAGDNVNADITVPLIFVYTSPAGADGKFSFFYGAPTPFDSDFSMAGSFRLDFRFAGFSSPVPITAHIFMNDDAISAAGGTLTKTLFSDPRMTSDMLNLPIGSFTGLPSFHLKHVIFIQVALDPVPGRSLILSQIRLVSTFPIPASYTWGMIILALVFLGTLAWLIKGRDWGRPPRTS